MPPPEPVVVGLAIFIIAAAYVLWFWYNRNLDRKEKRDKERAERYRGGIYTEIKLRCEHENCPLKGEIEVFHNITPQDLVDVLTCPECDTQRNIISKKKQAEETN